MDYTYSYYINKAVPIITYPNRLCKVLKLLGKLESEMQWFRKSIPLKFKDKPDFDILTGIVMDIEYSTTKESILVTNVTATKGISIKDIVVDQTDAPSSFITTLL